MPSPPSAARMASPFVTVERITLAPPEPPQFRRRIRFPAIDVVPRAQLLRERRLFFSPRDAYRFESHLCGKLHAQVAETAQAEHSHQLAGGCSAVAKAVKRGYTSTHQRRRFHSRQAFRHRRQRGDRSNHVIGISAVERGARHFGAGLARE